jgi:hypothetical protein
MSRPRGGFIGYNAAPAVSALNSAASGVWTLREAEALKRAGTWPRSINDIYFANVSLLLGMEGANGSTAFTDSGPLGLSVSPVNGPVISTAQAKFGPTSGLFVRSSNQYLTVPASTGAFTLGTGDFTIEAWVYPSSLPSGGGYPASFWICGWGLVDSDSGFDFYITNTAIGLNLVAFSTASVSGSHGMTAGQWYHLAATRSGTSLKLFVNGVEKASAISSEEAFTPGDNIAISAAEPDGATSGNFNGYIDGIRITKGVARYTAAFTAPSEPF